jgi:hypothetical protein
MRGQNHKRPYDTSSQTAARHRAADENRVRFFAGLEVFVNAGDSDEEYRNLQIQLPTFWPLRLQGPFGPGGSDGPLEWPAAGQSLFRAFRDYLRRLWRSDFYNDDGSMVDGRYLQYVLGLETRYAVDPPHGLIDAVLPTQAFREGWLVLRKEHEGVYCSGPANPLPNWRSNKFEYVGSNDFQKAVYQLLSESWRARVCRRCGKYFIADKAAQVFCSTSCSNQNKLEGGRRYWHEKGTTLREQRYKKK